MHIDMRVQGREEHIDMLIPTAQNSLSHIDMVSLQRVGDIDMSTPTVSFYALAYRYADSWAGEHIDM